MQPFEEDFRVENLLLIQRAVDAYRGTILSSNLHPTACAYLRSVANEGA